MRAKTSSVEDDAVFFSDPSPHPLPKPQSFPRPWRCRMVTVARMLCRSLSEIDAKRGHHVCLAKRAKRRGGILPLDCTAQCLYYGARRCDGIHGVVRHGAT